jgi:hypothetical protein
VWHIRTLSCCSCLKHCHVIDMTLQWCCGEDGWSLHGEAFLRVLRQVQVSSRSMVSMPSFRTEGNAQGALLLPTQHHKAAWSHHTSKWCSSGGISFREHDKYSRFSLPRLGTGRNLGFHYFDCLTCPLELNRKPTSRTYKKI